MAGPERFDPYRVLGVRRDASPAEIARAFRSLAKRSHPDLRGSDAESAADGARRMRELNRSWYILSDPARRRDWDAGHPAPLPGGAHWARPAAPPPPPRRAEPAEWAAWEAARPAPTPGIGRVRPADAWPRRTAEPARPSRVRDSGLLAGMVAAVLFVVVILLGWVASTGFAPATADEAIGAARIVPAARVALDAGHELVVYLVPGDKIGVASVRERTGGWQVQTLTEVSDRDELSVHVTGDLSGSDWRGIVFGRAPAGVVRVRLSVAATGGDVRDGLWVIGTRLPLRPEQVQWRFEAEDGSVVLSGSGELR
jgi:DnaJ domain